MKGFRTTENDIQIEKESTEHKKQFETEFNRYFFTKRYADAFDLCIQNLSDTYLDKNFVRSKAFLATEKLTNCIELSDKSHINRDWVIDVLINSGNRNMKVNANNIKIGSAEIFIAENDKIRINAGCRIHPAYITLLSLVITYAYAFVFVGMIQIVMVGTGDPVCGIFPIPIGIFLFLFIVDKWIRFCKKFRHHIRTIATAIVKEYYKD